MKIKPANPKVQVTAEPDLRAGERLAPGAGFPLQLKKILVPVDFSGCSKKALQYAIPLAQQFKARIIFLNVITPPYTFGGEFGLGDRKEFPVAELREVAERRLTALAREMVPAAIPVQIESRCGVESSEIVDTAKTSGIDLIVISTHGRTGRPHALAGSVAGDVAQLAPCPVLVVRERAHEFSPLRPAAQQPAAAIAA